MLPNWLSPTYLYRKGFLYIVVISMNMVCFSIGTVFAWASPAIPNLQTMYNITTGQVAVIASIHFIGSIFSTVYLLTLIKRIGKRLVILVLMSHLTVGYLLLAFSNQFYLFVLGRFLCGIAIGCYSQAVPVYIGEVSEIRNRGILGCFQSIFTVLGQIYTYSVGPFVSYKVLCLTLMLPGVIFILLAIFLLPESPYDCLIKRDEQKAKSVLKKLRFGASEDEIELELERIVEDLKRLNAGIKFTDIFLVKPLRKSLLINISLSFLQQFSGINAITGYLQLIFTWAGVAISPKLSPIYVILIQFVTTLTIPFYIETAGRKALLFVSQCFISLSLGGLATYFYLKNHDLHLPFYWLPITSLIIFFIFFMTGLGCIPYVLVGEIFPHNAKRVTCTIMVCFSGSLGFLVNWMFPILIEGIGADNTFWILTGVSGAGIVLVHVLVPETKLKSFQEIQQMLS